MTITAGAVGALLGEPVESLEGLAAGWESELLAATTRDGTRVVVRCLEGADRDLRTSREALGVGALRRLGFPVPEVIAVDGGGAVLGRPGIVYEFVGGPLCGDAVSDVGERSGLVGRLLGDLHAVSADEFAGQVGVAVPVDPIARQIEDWLTIMAGAPIPEMEGAVEWLVSHAGSVARVPATVVHLDLHPWNVICSPDGPVVVDWTGVGVSDPRFDLAWTMLLGESGGWGIGSAVLEEYGPVPDLDWFRAAAAVRRIYSVLLALRVGPEALGMRADAAEQIEGAAGELEFAARLLEDVTGIAVEVG